jgi:hypothetical protein
MVWCRAKGLCSSSNKEAATLGIAADASRRDAIPVDLHTGPLTRTFSVVFVSSSCTPDYKDTALLAYQSR